MPRQGWTVLGSGTAVFVESRQVEQHREPGGTLNEGADRRATQPEDEIAFPVPGNGPVVCLSRSLGDHDLGVNERLPSGTPASSRHPQRASRPKARRQLPTQPAAPLNV